MLVTVSSRCVAGRVKPRYGYEGGGLHLAKIGALLAGDLSGAKARLLQMVALGGLADSETARRVNQVKRGVNSPGLGLKSTVGTSGTRAGPRNELTLVFFSSIKMTNASRFLGPAVPVVPTCALSDPDGRFQSPKLSRRSSPS